MLKSSVDSYKNEVAAIMAQLFISHSEADSQLAEDLALALEGLGYSTWYFERDSVPGPSYLLQTGQAIKASSAFIVLISKSSLASNQVTQEIVRAHEESRKFLPILCGVTHSEFQHQQQEWREALGAAASVVLPRDGVSGILPRLERGLNALKIVPEAPRQCSVKSLESAEKRVHVGTPLDISALQNFRAVIVDDETSCVEYLKRFLQLKYRTIEVRTASDGPEALDIIRGFHPHLVIADIRLPAWDMGGLELIDAVRGNQELEWIAFIVISGCPSSEIESHLQSIGIPFFIKPFEYRELFEAVQKKLNASISKTETSVSVKPVSAPRPLPELAAAMDDPAIARECDFVFTERCRGQLATLSLSEAEVLALVQGEFRSHTNYLRFDLENYPLPLRSGYIAYLTKVGARVEFTGFVKCTADQAKLASWNDILTLYRRATRLAYRSDHNKLLLMQGALRRVIELHVDLRVRITKHFTSFERLPMEERVFFLCDEKQGGDRSSKEAMADEVAFQLRESARANEEASKVAQMLEQGDMTFHDALGTCVMETERSLQHIHNIITGYPPIA